MVSDTEKFPGNNKDEGIAMESKGRSGEEMKITKNLKDCSHGC